MIITQTPLRVSLFGGGTDFPDMYREDGGAVLSLAIDKYVYVIVKERFDEQIYVNYSKKEIVDRVDEIEHELVREAMRKTSVCSGVEITTLSDVPSAGSGLGSSSSVTVGLLNALYAYQNEQVPAEQLAREACEIEIDILGKPIGIQDQYIAAYGNLRFFEFARDGAVRAERVPLREEVKRQLVSQLMLFYIGNTRQAADVLCEQKRNIARRRDELRRLRDIAYQARRCLHEGPWNELGHLLHQSWSEKRKLASNVSNPEIDRLYDTARAAGALGGKIAGAGNGGFVLLYALPERHEAIRRALSGYRELPFLLGRDGSKVILNILGYEWK
jgi:D-glycero-alpha-D-manno-heptose-7-phosphate kinase